MSVAEALGPDPVRLPGAAEAVLDPKLSPSVWGQTAQTPV